MLKISLNPKPTFKSKVVIPVPGAETTPVNIEFKYRTRTEFTAWLDEIRGTENVPAIMSCVVGWDLEHDFNEANVCVLDETYMGASQAILGKYIEEVSTVRLKN